LSYFPGVYGGIPLLSVCFYGHPWDLFPAGLGVMPVLKIENESYQYEMNRSLCFVLEWLGLDLLWLPWS
jgi:hypothetical protein